MNFLTREQLILGKGFTASILLHGLVFGLIVYASQNSQQITVAEKPREYIVVTTQQRSAAKSAPEGTIPETPFPPVGATIADSPVDSLQESKQVDSESTPPADELLITDFERPATITTEEKLAAASSDPTNTEGTLTPSSLRAAVTTYVRSQQGTYAEAWVSACTIYKKEHGVQDCPQQRAEDYSGHKEERVLMTRVMNAVNRSQRYTRLTAQFSADNKELEKLMEGSDPVLAELARTRYSLNREYMAYLNGNFDFKTWAFVQAANPNMGNLEYQSGFMQVICNPRPCVWEYTGFKVVKPDLPDANPETDFKISTTVLGSSK